MKKKKTVLFGHDLDASMKDMFEVMVAEIVQDQSYGVNPEEKFIASATVTAGDVRRSYVEGIVTGDYVQDFDLFKKKRVDIDLEFDRGEISKIVIVESY